MPSPPTLPNVPILTFYDPNKRDQGIIEYISTETAAYVPLDLGVPHPNTRDYPGFRLGIQAAVPNNFGWVRRVWVTNETNPDWWNDQRKYSAEANAFPIFIRSYREEGKTYAPRTKLTPLDTVIGVSVFNAGSGYTPGTFPALTFSGGGGTGATGHAVVAPDGSIACLVLDNGGSGYSSTPTFVIDDPPSGITATGTAEIQPQTALLVAEQAEEYPSDSEFSGLFFNVTRVYETLPGPILTTKTIGQPNLTPEKYRRLVRTEETDQPVPATYTFPPGLTGDQTQIALQQETIAKARLKIISEIIAIGADAIVGSELNEFGEYKIYETVVNEGTAIDTGFYVFKSTVTAFGNGKAVKITVKYPSDLEDLVLEGQEHDESLGVVFPYQVRIVEAGEEIGELNKEITPIDYLHSRVKEIDLSAVSAIEKFVLALPSVTDLSFPDILESVRVVSEKSSGEGIGSEDGSGYWSGSGSYSITFQSTVQSSGAAMSDVVIKITQPYVRNIPTTHYLFFMKMPVTVAQVLARLATLTNRTLEAWPIFKPRMETILCFGQHRSVQARSSHHIHDGGSPDSAEHSEGFGSGISREVGLTIKAVRIPPTIHKAISLTGDNSESFGISASASSAGSTLGSDTVSSRVEADIRATIGENSIPTSGLRLRHVEGTPYKYGYAKIFAEVVDFAYIDYAPSIFGAGEGLAPTVSYAAVSKRSDTMATLNGSVSTGGLLTTYHWQYGTTTGYGTSSATTTLQPAFTSVPVSWDLTGLSPSTTYHYRLVATNSEGTATGPDQTFATHAFAAYAFYFSGKITVNHQEKEAGGVAGDYYTLEDPDSGYKVGIYADLSSPPVWWVYIGNPSAPTDSAYATFEGDVTFKDTPWNVYISVSSDGDNLFVNASIDGAGNIDHILTDTGGQNFTKLHVGAKHVRTSSTINRTVKAGLIGSTLNGRNLWDGDQLDTTVVPPFDSVTGSSVSVLAGSNKLKVITSTQAYATVAF